MSASLTDRQREAIDAVKAAIRALPRGIHISIDEDDEAMVFWKAHPEGGWKGVGKLVSTGRFFW